MDVFMRDRIKSTAIIALIAVALLYIPARLIYFRLYTGDRIEGEISLTIDGQEYSLKDSDLTFEFEHEKTSGKYEDGQVSLKAGDYGQYLIIINCPQDIPPITIGVMQANWWNKESFELTIEVDRERGSVTYSGKQKYITELGFSQSGLISKSQPLTDGELFVGFGL